MRLPTFSRQSDTTAETEDRAPVSARTDAPTQSGAVQAGRPEDLADADRAAEDRTAANRTAANRTAATGAIREQDARTEELRTERARTETRHADGRDRTLPMAAVDHDKTRQTDRDVDRDADRTPEPLAGPKPRASLLATLGLITGVAGALLVLSGPLLGYGIGVAGLALILSIAGIRATNKRHVAGKTDALIGMVLALAAIVVGVLALTGSLSWLGTDTQPVSSLREWLDTQFVDRF